MYSGDAVLSGVLRRWACFKLRKPFETRKQEKCSDRYTYTMNSILYDYKYYQLSVSRLITDRLFNNSHADDSLFIYTIHVCYLSNK